MNYEFEKLKTDAVIISLKNILVQCLKSFKQIVISAVVCALVVALLVYVSDLRKYNNALSNSANGVPEVELTDDDRIAVEKYCQLKSKFVQMSEYIENSLYMQLEFTNVHQGTLLYQVLSDEAIKYDLANAIVSYVNEGNMVSMLADKYPDIETKYLQELISAEIVDATENGTSGVISICIWTDSDEMSQNLTNQISKLIEDYSGLLKREIGYCSVKKVQEGCVVRCLESIYEQQTDVYTEFEEISTEYNTQAAKMTEAQMLTVNSLDEEKAESQTETLINKPTLNIKFAVVGAIVGIMLVVMYVCVKTILGGKIQTEKEIALRLGVMHLGSEYFIGKTLLEKLMLKFIYGMDDRSLNKQTEVLVSRISMCLSSSKTNKIAFVGTSEKVMSSRMEDIVKLLEKAGFESVLLGNVLTNPDALYGLTKVENIIFVETIGTSRIRDLYEEAEICINAQKQIVGYISAIE